MAQRSKDSSFRALIDRFTRDLGDAIAAQVEQQIAAAVLRLGKAGGKPLKADGRRAGRLCPVPGCGEPGAGPRNRWFCRDHAKKLSVTEQKSILARNHRLEEEGKLPTSVPSDRVVKLPAREKRPRRALDMSCRVEGCTNRSRGPRAGFICDQHRQELSPEEQKAARDRWNARAKGLVVAPVEPPPVKPLPSAVPPIVRKAEPASEAS